MLPPASRKLLPIMEALKSNETVNIAVVPGEEADRSGLDTLPPCPSSCWWWTPSGRCRAQRSPEPWPGISVRRRGDGAMRSKRSALAPCFGMWSDLLFVVASPISCLLPLAEVAELLLDRTTSYPLLFAFYAHSLSKVAQDVMQMEKPRYGPNIRCHGNPKDVQGGG